MIGEKPVFKTHNASLSTILHVTSFYMGGAHLILSSKATSLNKEIRVTFFLNKWVIDDNVRQRKH